MSRTGEKALSLRHEKIFGEHIIGLYFNAIGFILSRRMQR
jgi:hypothetical protein